MDWKYLYTSFDGRINRQPFWMGILGLIGAAIVVGIISGILAAAIHSSFAYLSTIFSLICIYPAMALYAKRWHDRGKSGWWTLIALIPFVGAIWLLVELGFLEGTPGPNQYGPNPLGTYRTA